MQTFEPQAINRLFIRQIMNLTRANTVYVHDDVDKHLDELLE